MNRTRPSVQAADLTHPASHRGSSGPRADSLAPARSQRRRAVTVTACGFGLQPIRDRSTIVPIPAATDGPPCTPSA